MSSCQIVQRLPGLRRREQVAVIRANVEGVFAQSEELFAHVRVVRLVAAFSVA
jgi:hypothetical protein